MRKLPLTHTPLLFVPEMLPQRIILFDGVCNFCNRWVNFIIRHDKKGKIKFAALQSETGKKLLTERNLTELVDKLDTFIFIDEKRVYTRSSAGIRIAKYLNGNWKLFSVFIIVPKFIRDAMYKWLAKNRYKWWGKRNECMIPTEEVKERFLL